MSETTSVGQVEMSTATQDDTHVAMTNKESIVGTDGDSTMNTEDNNGDKPVSLINKEEVKRRSKRMLGVMLGTLNSFKKANDNKTDAERRREALETKLQDRMSKEKEKSHRMLQEKQQRQAKTVLMRRRLHCSSFLKTTTGPKLYYLPAKLTDKQAAQLKEQVSETKHYVKERMPELLERNRSDETDDVINVADGRDQRLGEEHDETMLEMEAELTSNNLDTMQDDSDEPGAIRDGALNDYDMELTEK
ncbi:hypothetical protein BDF19DRAFT_419719 [Syncephalis fuscata]|nr:hypothetical protein BDF19DRAFT_419719 [Syncephalis fuscata]